MFIPLGQVFTVPLLLLTLFLIATREKARPYLLFLLIGSLLVGLGMIGPKPFSAQLARFVVGFTMAWIVLGLVTFIVWLVVSAFYGNPENDS